MNVRNRLTRLAALVVAGVTALTISAIASSSTSHATKKRPSLAQLVKQSKRESGLVVYGNPPGRNWSALSAAFTKKYPWIKTTEYDLEDNTIFSKYGAESAQGSRTADLLIASAPNLWIYAHRKGYAMNFVPTGLKSFPSFAKSLKGIYVMSPDPAVIFWNKLLLGSKRPTSVAAIANDSSTYNAVTGYTVDNTFGYTALYGYVQLRGWSALQKIGRRLKPQTGVAGQRTLVSQGGAKVAILSSPTIRLNIETDSNLGRILDWTYIHDAEPLIPRQIAITKKASSPASAKLFLNFIYSKQGQQAMCEAGFTAFMKGFKPSGGCTNTLNAVYKAVGKKHVFLVRPVRKFVNARPKFASKWHSIFG
jgi:iron(III) transport system substrate-binding protein